uniref:Uncharacterized protein n=1 Tax=Globodera rostochiensis TaxID=31243 RepID=A0A914H950_GLORO
MLGWWRLLLLYGIAINLGIDESVSTALDMNGYKASRVNGPKGSDQGCNGSSEIRYPKSDVNGSNTLDKNGSNASDLNIFTASDGNGSNASDGNGSNASGVNGSNTSEKNGSNASGANTSEKNGSTASDVNGSNASDMNGVTSRKDDDDVAELLGFPKGSDVNGSNTSDVNGPNTSDVNGSTALDENGPNALGLKGTTASNVKVSSENKNIVTKSGRQKRDDVGVHGLSTVVHVLFGTALVKAVTMKSGKRVVNTEADRFIGGELSNYTFFARDALKNCTAECSCGWGNCVPWNDDPGDACCLANYTMSCCQNLDFVGQKLCLKAPKSCRIDSTELCDFEKRAFVLRSEFTNDTGKGYGQGLPTYIGKGYGQELPTYTGKGYGQGLRTRVTDLHGQGLRTRVTDLHGQGLRTRATDKGYRPTGKGYGQELPTYTGKGYGQGLRTRVTDLHGQGLRTGLKRRAPSDPVSAQKNTGYGPRVQPAFFLENREGCPMCGWEVCIILSERLGCSCCAYKNLADCRWDLDGGCIYAPDVERDKDSRKCPDCQWKMSISNDDSVVKCCDQSRLHHCTKNSTLVNENAACKRLVEDQCHCGWGSCFPREGRAAGKCCKEHYGLACCEGSRRLELNGSNTKAEISKVFLMLLVMRLAVRRILAEMAD